MGPTDVNHKKKENEENDSLKGTLFSVGMVGVVIFVTYIVIYGLYTVRV